MSHRFFPPDSRETKHVPNKFYVINSEISHRFPHHPAPLGGTKSDLNKYSVRNREMSHHFPPHPAPPRGTPPRSRG